MHDYLYVHHDPCSSDPNPHLHRDDEEAEWHIHDPRKNPTNRYVVCRACRGNGIVIDKKQGGAKWKLE